MRFFRLSYITAGSTGAGSVFFFGLPFVAVECSWRADADVGVEAGPVGGGFAVRGGAAEVVAVAVTVPFIAASGGRFEEKGLEWGLLNV
jgi:hypothetical protein